MEWHQFVPAIGHLPARSHTRIKKAFELGKSLHEGQTRKSGEPYFIHPMAVAGKLAEAGADEDTIIAALLHDTVEDTPATLEDIERKFGPAVKTLIDGVTKLSVSEVSGPNLNEQMETLRKIFRLMQTDSRIMVIKLYDRLHNMETIQYLSESKQKILAQETYDVYAKIADRLCMEDLRYELEEHCLRILKPNLLDRLLVLREKTMSQGQSILLQMERTLASTAGKLMSDVQTELERKMWGKLEAQLEVEGIAVSGLSPVTLAFVCPDRDACYRMLGALHEPWRREVLSFRDFVNSPELNGYRGLHTTVILEDGTRVRCKIRTEEMHAYAHRGITLYCFNLKQKHLLFELLPWLEQLESLTEDTQHKSEDFWQSLQSDILGETVTIYGPDDKSVQIPKNASVLDGAFYLFGDATHRIDAIFVNGKNVSFSDQIQHATSLSVQFAEDSQLTQEWLQWARTSFAVAKIRGFLALRDEKEQLQEGRKKFQDLLFERKKGFLEEFDDARLQQGAKELGYPSLSDAYIAIAQGRMLPTELLATTLEQKKIMRQDRQHVRVQFRMNMDDLSGLERVKKVEQRFIGQTQRSRVIRDAEVRAEKTFLLMHLSGQEVEELVQSLTKCGATKIRVESQRGFLGTIILSAFLALIWGFDPIFAKMLLTEGVAPASFTLIRAVTLVILGGIVLIANNPKQRFSRIPFANPNLWLAGASFFGVSLLTYLALQSGSPILYNTVLRGNAVLLAIPLLLGAKFYRRLIFAVLCTIAGYELLFLHHGWTWSLILAFMVLLFFCVYTVASRRFQDQAKIAARYPQFFFFSSAISCVCAVLLVLVMPPASWPSMQLLGLLVGYCVIFIGFPYLAFYGLMLRTGYSSVSPWINLSLLVTLVGQAWLLPMGNELFFIWPALFLILGSTIASRSLAREGD